MRALFLNLILAWAAHIPAEIPSLGGVEATPHLGTVAVVTPATLPKFQYQIPIPKTEAARELAGEAASQMASDIHSAGLAPMGALAGFMFGMVKGVTASKSRAAELIITNTVAEFPLTGRLCHWFTNQAALNTGESFAVVTAKRTIVPGRRFTPLENTPNRPGMWDRNESVDFTGDKFLYPGLAQQGMNTALELEVMHYGLEYRARTTVRPPPIPVNAPLTLIMVVEARLIQLRDGEVLQRSRVEFEGPHQRFSAWAANDARPLQEALEDGCRCTAADLVDQLFFPSAARSARVNFTPAIFSN